MNPLVHPDDAASVKQMWEAHLAGKTPRYESEHRRRASDGSWRWILDRGKVVERAEAGNAVRITGTLTDITERRALEASLGAAERMESLGLLASGFALAGAEGARQALRDFWLDVASQGACFGQISPEPTVFLCQFFQ